MKELSRLERGREAQWAGFQGATWKWTLLTEVFGFPRPWDQSQQRPQRSTWWPIDVCVFIGQVSTEDRLRDLYSDRERTLPSGEGQWVQSARSEDFTPWQTGRLAGSRACCLLSGPPPCFPRAAGEPGGQDLCPLGRRCLVA